MDIKQHFLTRLLECGAAGGMPVIAEIKAYTPVAGDLLRQRKVEDIVQQYEKAGMACVSVVTGRWFGGSPALLNRVAGATSLPVLRKDFIASRSAIERSRELGASAVLLTRKIVNAGVLKKLVEQALSFGLTPFIEVASAREMEGLELDGEAVLAINNRDISSRETDLGDIATSLSLLDAARATGAGAVVSASAITTADEAKQLLNAGFDGLLIGTAFLSAPDLSEILDVFRARLFGANG